MIITVMMRQMIIMVMMKTSLQAVLSKLPNIAFPSLAIKRIKRFAALCALFVGGGQP